MKLLIATGNAHKLDEIRNILSIPAIELVSLKDFPGLTEVEEDGLTFEANAVKKAVAGARGSGLWAMADDSGLEVDALAGAPGVRSARYAGEPVSYPANNRKLLLELAGKENRKARFRCAITLCSPAGWSATVDGSCEGRIIDQERGAKGFGYDPLFVPDGFEQTFAEMEQSAKNRISHRARALAAAKAAWGAMLAGVAISSQPV